MKMYYKKRLKVKERNRSTQKEYGLPSLVFDLKLGAYSSHAHFFYSPS